MHKITRATIKDSPYMIWNLVGVIPCGYPKLTKLFQAHSLVVPKEENQEQWQNFASELQTIMQSHCNIGHEWNFTEEQREKLERYFRVNHLLVQHPSYITN